MRKSVAKSVTLNAWRCSRLFWNFTAPRSTIGFAVDWIGWNCPEARRQEDLGRRENKSQFSCENPFKNGHTRSPWSWVMVSLSLFMREYSTQLKGEDLGAWTRHGGQREPGRGFTQPSLHLSAEYCTSQHVATAENKLRHFGSQISRMPKAGVTH